ncbi:uncharacterized protein LOC143513804 [Brachyhypopomus gauderio]|uniref:uncharacterized protein LOC143513804 n=1 Tax=Brachyhypopomus gauderio TaxID=698409 RepID=UPI004041016A
MKLAAGEEQAVEGSLREEGPCLLPPINCGVTRTAAREDPILAATHEQQEKLKDNRCLLAELVRIEQELRETLHREEHRQQQMDKRRREENQQRWESLCFLSLNQRTAKPWVTSYYRNIPMHIYCLPIETVVQRKRRKRR